MSQYSAFSVKNRRTSLAAEIDRRPPRRRYIAAKHLRSVERQIIAVRSEMIVDDVEKNHQAVAVRCVDQRLQFVGLP